MSVDLLVRPTIRPAAAADYDVFARLFPELGVDDPVPSKEAWTNVLAPSSYVAERAGEVLGYCYFQEYTDTGYIRNVVVAPEARRAGVGRALMLATAEHFRENGKRTWRLNVKPTNAPALALYARLGMTVEYRARAVTLPWSALARLPPGDAIVSDLEPDRATLVEQTLALPRGQLAASRGGGRLSFEATQGAERLPVGVAVFDPGFPGAFPFRVRTLDAVTPLLAAMRRHVPDHDIVKLVIEDDERLSELLTEVGAITRLEILHLSGPL